MFCSVDVLCPVVFARVLKMDWFFGDISMSVSPGANAANDQLTNDCTFLMHLAITNFNEHVEKCII